MATKIISVQDRQAAGAGDDLQIQAGSASGAFGGGSVILQGGLQGSSGGDGKIVVKQRSGQNGNLLEWQNSSGTALASVDISGRLSLPSVASGVWNGTAVGIAYGGTGQTTAASAYNALTPITTLGDLVYGSGTNAATRLAGNTTTTKQFLSQTGTGSASAAPSWSTVSKSDVGLGSVENTALSTWAGSSNITTLGTVATGTWSATTIALNKGGTGATTQAGAANAVLPTQTANSGKYLVTDGSNVSWSTVTAGGGSVTSVALSLPAIFSVTGSPVQSSGTLTGTLANQNANLVFAGPTTGAATTPSFRSLVAADLPTITSLGTVTSGTWNATAIGIAYGGTGQTSAAAAFNALSPITTLGDIIYGSGTNAATRLAGNTTATKQFLSQTGNGTVSAAPSWSTVSKSDVGLANVENTALSTWAGSANITTLGTVATGTWNATAIGVAKGGTNLTTYTAGDLVYASATTTLSKLAIGTSGQVLTSNGTAPYWATAAAGASVSISDSAPGSPSAGNLWWESSTGTLKIYYNDGNTSQWVDALPAASSIGGVLTSVELKNYAETQTSPTISAGALTLNLANGNTFTVSLNADITTLSITNVPTGSKAVSFTLLFTADGTARTVTWPASVKWPNATTPTLTSTAGQVDIYTFLSVDNGTTWYGMQAGKNF